MRELGEPTHMMIFSANVCGIFFIVLSDSELFEEFYFIFVEETKIIDAIFYHRDTSESKTEGKTRIFFWIDICLSQDIWMTESATHKFEPATFSIAFPPEIDFHAWLHKWEVARAHTEFWCISKKFCENSGNCSLEVTNIDIFIYDNSFNLFEHDIMSRIYFFVAIH